jgi:hypothetical protein
MSRPSVGLQAHCEVGHSPPDRDAPFWVGCSAFLEPEGLFLLRADEVIE